MWKWYLKSAQYSISDEVYFTSSSFKTFAPIHDCFVANGGLDSGEMFHTQESDDVSGWREEMRARLAQEQQFIAELRARRDRSAQSSRNTSDNEQEQWVALSAFPVFHTQIYTWKCQPTQIWKNTVLQLKNVHGIVKDYMVYHFFSR